MPLCVATPLIVTVFDAHDAVMPPGKPLAIPIPVAPVVVCVMSVSAVPIHKVGAEDPAPDVLLGPTVIVPVAKTFPQPPVKGML